MTLCRAACVCRAGRGSTAVRTSTSALPQPRCAPPELTASIRRALTSVSARPASRKMEEMELVLVSVLDGNLNTFLRAFTNIAKILVCIR